MVTIKIQEYKNSPIETRHNVPTQHAHNMGKDGGFYKVQILGEFDQIEVEYKA